MTSNTDANQTPESKSPTSTHLPNHSMEYVGFLPRLGAGIVDAILLGIIMFVIFAAIFGLPTFDQGNDIVVMQSAPMDQLISNIVSTVISALVVIVCWMYWAATPGKMLFSAIIVDAGSGEKASFGQLIGRYLSYFISSFALGLGFLWIAFDKRNQGWHDKLAGTVVIKKR